MNNKNVIARFATSENLFAWIVGMLVLCFWTLDMWVIGIVAICFLAAVAFTFCKDTSRILAILFMFVMIISADSHSLNNYLWVVFVGVGLLVAGLVIHIIRFKPSIKRVFTEGKIKGFGISLLLLTIPMTIGGITRGDRNIFALLLVAAYFIAVSVFYLFFHATTERKKGDELLRYIILIMLITGIVLSLQVVIYYIRIGNIDAIISLIKIKKLDLGWAGSNQVGPMLSLCLPASIYYAINKKKSGFLFIILAFIQYILIFVSGCRGAILFTTLAMPFMLCYAMAKTVNKIMVGLTISLCLSIIILFVAYYSAEIIDIFGRMMSYGLSNNGRFDLYQEAIDVFKKFPVFGAGLDHKLGEMAGDGYTPYWYHSTILQVLASTGVVGFVFFTNFAFWRYSSALLTRKYRVQKLTIAAGLILFELYGMIDVNFFGPTFFICMVIMSLAIEKSFDNKKIKPYKL